MISRSKSEELFKVALEHIPGGVNSPVRAFRGVGGQPFFVDRAEGARIWDVDGNEYIDYVGTWGPAILGHAHPKIISAVQATAERGTSFGIPNPLEVRMAEVVKAAVSSIQKIRVCNSGTEACMSAIRIARGFTDRPKIIKFDGCYHGHADSLLVSAGSGALTFGNPDSAGVPPEFTAHTVVVPFNDEAAVREAFAANEGQIAGVILEPVPANAGLYLPRSGFLEFLREITEANGSLLIFDEVITGFRVGLGGAQERFGITPDLTCLGKIVGGGLPAAAYGGRRDIMENVSPLGMKVSQAGTLSGNPLAMTAGLEQLKMLSEPGVYDRLELISASLADGMTENMRKLGLNYAINRVGGMLCMFFTDGAVGDFAAVGTVDLERFNRYFWAMLDRGVYLAPSQYECMFPSLAHTDLDIDETLRAHFEALKEVH